MKRIVNKLENLGLNISSINPVVVTGNRFDAYRVIKAEFNSAIIVISKKLIIVKEGNKSYKIKVA